METKGILLTSLMTIVGKHGYIFYRRSQRL